jgi:hypothetical protein
MFSSILSIIKLIFKKTFIPCEDEFWKIHKESVVIDSNDCSNKTGSYLRILHDKGFTDSYIVIYKLSSKNVLHAVVKYKDKYYDPTFGKVYNKINNYRFSIKRENLDNWGKEFEKI